MLEHALFARADRRFRLCAQSRLTLGHRLANGVTEQLSYGENDGLPILCKRRPSHKRVDCCANLGELLVGDVGPLRRSWFVDGSGDLVELVEPRTDASFESLAEPADLTRDRSHRAVEGGQPAMDLGDRSPELGHVAFDTTDATGHFGERLPAGTRCGTGRKLLDPL